jgi:hypothetical protein
MGYQNVGACIQWHIVYGNIFSFAGMTLTSLAGSDSKTVTMLGSMLFLRCVSGTRVVTGVDLKEVAGYKFEGKNYFN